MLNQLYIGNYKCWQRRGFIEPIRFDEINLLLGENGVGKSTVFEVLGKLQQLLVAPTDEAKLATVSTLFPRKTVTRWGHDKMQHFHLHLTIDETYYIYTVSLSHLDNPERTIIKDERLYIDSRAEKPIVYSNGSSITFRDDNNKGTRIPTDGTRSALQILSTWQTEPRIEKFREQLQRIIILKPNPFAMSSEGIGESKYIYSDGSNFASWYKYISRDQGLSYKITNKLKECLEEFSHFYFEPFGENRHQLRVFFGSQWYRFDELSDGQKVLILLNILLVYSTHSNDKKYILCIDEPGNYLALPEIQPFLTDWSMAAEDGDIQALIISHHPESINYLASTVGMWFQREDNNSPVRISSLSTDIEGLKMSELVARGWIE